MSEKKDYQLFRKNVCEANDRVDRIENFIVNGMPDINYCFDGFECWIEIKSPKEPKRESTSLFGSNHKLSIDQMNWFLRQKNAGGKGFIFIKTDKRAMIIEQDYADFINLATVNQLIEIALWHEKEPIGKDKWKDLKQRLISTKSNS